MELGCRKPSKSDVIQSGATVGGFVGGLTTTGLYYWQTALSGASFEMGAAADAAGLGTLAGGFAGIAIFLVVEGFINGVETTPVEGATGSGGSPPPGSKATDEEGRYSNS